MDLSLVTNNNFNYMCSCHFLSSALQSGRATGHSFKDGGLQICFLNDRRVWIESVITSISV